MKCQPLRPLLLPKLGITPPTKASTPPDYIPMKWLPRRQGPSIEYLVQHYQRNVGTCFVRY